MNFLHVNFQMISSLKHLTTCFTGMGHEAPLMLMSNMTKQRAFEIKNSCTNRALKLGPFRGLTHGIHGISIGYPLESSGGGVACRALPSPTSQTSV